MDLEQRKTLSAYLLGQIKQNDLEISHLEEDVDQHVEAKAEYAKGKRIVKRPVGVKNTDSWIECIEPPNWHPNFDYKAVEKDSVYLRSFYLAGGQKVNVAITVSGINGVMSIQVIDAENEPSTKADYRD
jgi:hypothetical protein